MKRRETREKGDGMGRRETDGRYIWEMGDGMGRRELERMEIHERRETRREGDMGEGRKLGDTDEEKGDGEGEQERRKMGDGRLEKGNKR